MLRTVYDNRRESHEHLIPQLFERATIIRFVEEPVLSQAVDVFPSESWTELIDQSLRPHRFSRFRCIMLGYLY